MSASLTVVFLVFTQLLLCSSSIFNLQHPIKSATLTPNELVDNGASIDIVTGGTVTIDAAQNTCTINQISDYKWNLLISLNDSWRFDPNNVSTISITIHSDDTDYDLFESVFASFSVLGTDQYVAARIYMNDYKGNRMSPECGDIEDLSTYPEWRLMDGNVLSLVSNENICDLMDGCSIMASDYDSFIPLQTSDDQFNSFPITFILENHPLNNSVIGPHSILRYKSSAFNPFYHQSCGLAPFATDHGLNIALGILQNSLSINSIDVQYFYGDTKIRPMRISGVPEAIQSHDILWFDAMNESWTESGKWTLFSADDYTMHNKSDLCPVPGTNCWCICDDNHLYTITPTVGYTNISLTFSVNPEVSLSTDYCQLAYSLIQGSTTWTPFFTTTSFDDFPDDYMDRFVYQTINLPTNTSNNTGVGIRVLSGKSYNDCCYFSDFYFSGTPIINRNITPSISIHPSRYPTTYPSVNPTTTRYPSANPTEYRTTIHSIETTSDPTALILPSVSLTQQTTTANPTDAPFSSNPTFSPSGDPLTHSPTKEASNHVVEITESTANIETTQKDKIASNTAEEQLSVVYFVVGIAGGIIITLVAVALVSYCKTKRKSTIDISTIDMEMNGTAIGTSLKHKQVDGETRNNDNNDVEQISIPGLVPDHDSSMNTKVNDVMEEGVLCGNNNVDSIGKDENEEQQVTKGESNEIRIAADEFIVGGDELEIEGNTVGNTKR